jgi:AcrR family transcriptional regulator
MSKNATKTKKERTTAGTKKPGKMDRRVYRTREALGDALVSLMIEKSYDEITVQQVLERAKVGRSTFYTHFVDKNDLFMSDVDDFWTLMSSMLTRRGEKSERVAPVKEFFEHVAEARAFYDSLVASGRVHEVVELGQAHLAGGIQQRLEAIPRASVHSAGKRKLMSQAFSGAFFSLLSWWLSHPQSGTPAEMDEMFHRMVWSGVGK